MLKLIHISGNVLLVNSCSYDRCYVKKLIPLCTPYNWNLYWHKRRRTYHNFHSANTQIILLASIPSLKLWHLACSCDNVSRALPRLPKSSHTAYLTRSTAIVAFPKPKQTANPLWILKTRTLFSDWRMRDNGDKAIVARPPGWVLPLRVSLSLLPPGSQVIWIQRAGR